MKKFTKVERERFLKLFEIHQRMKKDTQNKKNN